MAAAFILGIGGSLGKESVSDCALKYALECARAHGATAELWCPKIQALPLFNPSDRIPTENYKILSAQLARADAVILATPDYHGGPSGAMKNTLDHFWREFAGKLFGYICASHEKGLTAMDQLRTNVRQCYGWSLPYGVALSDEDANDDCTAISGERVRKRLDMMAYDLIHYGSLMRRQFRADLDSNGAVAGFAAQYRPKK